MSGVEFWTSGAGVPVANARQAARAEAAGWDGIVYVDSQNLVGDCYIALALAAQATTRLKLGTGVTNPFTRHAAVTASAIATVQAESGGRAYLGIGRGDSALAHLGYAPAKVRVLEDYVRRVQAYLRGESVAFDDDATLDELELAEQPEGSKLEWLREGQPKVPVDVAATGPRVIAAAARQADTVSFAVGADPTRVRWGMDVAREARAAAGSPGSLSFAAYIPVVAHDDPTTARRLGEGGLSLFARFSVMHGEVLGPVSGTERRVLQQIHEAYDMTQHSRAGSAQAGLLTDEFASEFGIYGSSDHCVQRLGALIELGVEKIFVVGPTAQAGSTEGPRAAERFVEEVLPQLRGQFNH